MEGSDPPAAQLRVAEPNSYIRCTVVALVYPRLTHSDDDVAKPVTFLVPFFYLYGTQSLPEGSAPRILAVTSSTVEKQVRPLAERSRRPQTDLRNSR